MQLKPLGHYFEEKQVAVDKSFSYYKQAEQLWQELTTAAPEYAEFQNNLSYIKGRISPLQ